MPQKNVMVIGGAGFIGAHTVLALREAGYHTVVYDDFSAGFRDAVFSDVLVEGALSDRQLLQDTLQTHRIDAVVHFAALIEAGESVRDPLLFYRNNVAGTLTLLEAMAGAGVRRLVFSSTAAVYGEVTDGALLSEDLPQLPVNPYGATKSMVERMLTDHAAAGGIQAIALRYFNAAGADPQGRTGERHDPETHLIPLVLQTAAGLRPKIFVNGTDYPTPDGTCVRDYVHVHDLALGHVAAVARLIASDNEVAGVEAINLGTGRGYSILEVIDAAKSITGIDFDVEVGPRRAGDPARLVADVSRAADRLGWQAQHSDLEEIVRDAWNYFRTQPGWS